MQNDRLVLLRTTWCGHSRRTPQFYEQHDIEHGYADIDQDLEAVQLVQDINHAHRIVPPILSPDGSTLTEPSIRQLTERLRIDGQEPRTAIDRKARALRSWGTIAPPQSKASCPRRCTLSAGQHALAAQQR
jgi:mycoredoxin